MTVSKIVAGAGAAATSAVAGSIFGADGTVVGAAVGSVVSAVTAAAYERSLDRTRKVVVSRVRLPSGHTAEVTQVIPADAGATQVLDPDATQIIPAQQQAAGIRSATAIAPVLPSRRSRLPLLIGATALIFLVGLLAVTGVELLAGGPVLSSQKGTSVARVLGYSPSSVDPSSTVDPTTAAAATSSATATSSSAASTTVGKADRAAPASGSAAAGRSAAPRTSARVSETLAPTSANAAQPLP